MRIDLLSSRSSCNATVVDRAVKFVDRHKDLISQDSGGGLMPQNSELVVDNDPAEPIENTE